MHITSSQRTALFSLCNHFKMAERCWGKANCWVVVGWADWASESGGGGRGSSGGEHIGLGKRTFLRRKIVHAHDNSADSENTAGARDPNVLEHFIFRFENGQ